MRPQGRRHHTTSEAAIGSVIQDLASYFRDSPFAAAAAAVGGMGIINVLDSVIMHQLGITWTLVPEWLRPIFTLVREWWRPLVEWAVQVLPFQVSDPLKDYMLMGTIVAGMRSRSSWVIWSALGDGSLRSYEQKTALPKRPLVLRRGQWSKFLGVFLPIRLGYAFLAWPAKLVGAVWRYSRQQWGDAFVSGDAREARRNQYMAFFVSVVWALFGIFICLVLR